MSRMLLILILLHVYIGARVLPDLPFGLVGVVVGIAALAASAWLIPHGFRSRRTVPTGRAQWLTWAGLLAIGSFSSLVVLTLLRDVVLLAALALDAVWSGGVPLRLL